MAGLLSLLGLDNPFASFGQLPTGPSGAIDPNAYKPNPFLAMSAALGKAAQPSRLPTSTLGALGEGFGAIQQDRMNAQKMRLLAEQERRLNQQTEIQRQEYERAQKNREETQRLFQNMPSLFGDDSGQSSTQPAAPADSGAVATPPKNAQEFIERYMPMAQKVSQETGIDPRLVLAQAGLESAWGTKAPGNNLFGIKGPGQQLNTQESINGQMVPVRDSFRTYGSPEESFRDYAAFLRNNPRYGGVLGAQGLEAQIDAMGKSGYATDPNYAGKLRMLARGITIPQGGQALPAAAVEPQMAAAPTQVASADPNFAPQPQQQAPAQPQAQPQAAPLAAAPAFAQQQRRVLQEYDKAMRFAAMVESRGPEAKPLAEYVRAMAKARIESVGYAETRDSDGNLMLVNRFTGKPEWAPRPQFRGVRQEDGTTRYINERNLEGVVEAPEAPTGYRWGQGRQSLAPIGGGPADPDRPQPPPAGFQPAGSGRRFEAIEGGPEDPKKQEFARTNTLRDEYTKLTEPFRIIQDAHQKVVANSQSQTGPGDMAMLYGIVKMLDPTSVVRESEFAMAASMGSYGERIQGAVARILTGERLPENVRREFINEANAIAESQRKSYDTIRTQYTNLARSFKLDPAQVVVDYSNTPETSRPGGGQGGGNEGGAFGGGGSRIGGSSLESKPAKIPDPLNILGQ